MKAEKRQEKAEKKALRKSLKDSDASDITDATGTEEDAGTEVADAAGTGT